MSSPREQPPVVRCSSASVVNAVAADAENVISRCHPSGFTPRERARVISRARAGLVVGLQGLSGTDTAALAEVFNDHSRSTRSLSSHDVQVAALLADKERDRLREPLIALRNLQDVDLPPGYLNSLREIIDLLDLDFPQAGEEQW